MPLKSKSQVRKWFSLAQQGKITEGQLREAIRSSPPLSELPERAKPERKKR